MKDNHKNKAIVSVRHVIGQLLAFQKNKKLGNLCIDDLRKLGRR